MMLIVLNLELDFYLLLHVVTGCNDKCFQIEKIKQYVLHYGNNSSRGND